MQKTALRTILIEEILRAGVFGITFFIVVVGTLAGVASAASSGGLFGDILNQILASGNYMTAGETGTVKNAAKLGNYAASDYQRIAAPGQACGASQCIYGFDTSGNILCR